MVRDADGRVRATLERGGAQAPSAGRRRVFEAERTCKLALAHEGKAACDVRIHLTLDAAGADGAVWRDRRTYSGAKAAGGIGLLQSHLQKNIRRGNIDLAVRSAHELAGITFGPTDPTGFRTLVRRLPVIAVRGRCPLIRNLRAPTHHSRPDARTGRGLRGAPLRAPGGVVHARHVADGEVAPFL